MYKISTIKADRQGDEIFNLELADGTTKELHIWDYKILYSYPNLYQSLIIDYLDCRVYEAIGDLLNSVIEKGATLRILDIACGSGLMGKRLRENHQFTVDYLAGIEILPEALTALERDTPNIYDRCFLSEQDDLSQLKTKNINCMIICGAASHMTLENYKSYLSLLSEETFIAFNLIGDPLQQHRREILQWMNENYQLLKNKPYRHRKLMNGSYIHHEVFVYCQKI